MEIQIQIANSNDADFVYKTRGEIFMDPFDDEKHLF